MLERLPTLVLATVLAALAGQGVDAAASGAPSSVPTTTSVEGLSDPPETLQEVTVTAHRIELEKRISKFVGEITARQNFDEGIARWHRPVCPLVSGLPRDDGEFILGRVSEIARDAGVKLGDEQCKPNFYIS